MYIYEHNHECPIDLHLGLSTKRETTRKRKEHDVSCIENTSKRQLNESSQLWVLFEGIYWHFSSTVFSFTILRMIFLGLVPSVWKLSWKIKDSLRLFESCCQWGRLSLRWGHCRRNNSCCRSALGSAHSSETCYASSIFKTYGVFITRDDVKSPISKVLPEIMSGIILKIYVLY